MKPLILCLLLAAPAVAQDEDAEQAAQEPEASGTLQTPGRTRRHTVVKGDCLWDLAGFYYENHFRWKVIHAANTDQIKDPHWIYPGQVFAIPDVVDPVVGELGARPVETAAAAVLPPEPAPAPPPAPAPKVPEPPAPRAVEAPPPPAGPLDDLSAEMPPAQTGHYPSAIRVKRERGWREDGEVTQFLDGREVLVAAGDNVQARVRSGAPIAVGTRFVVYRRDAREELDLDTKAVYLQWIGVAEVKKDMGDSIYTLHIMKAGGPVLVGDILEREGA